MVNITIVGAGTYGERITNKYRKFATTQIRAVVSRSQPKSKVFSDVPFFSSANAWKNKFGTPDKKDVFDICVHHYLLIILLEDFIAIGAKNFILPKPIALTRSELLKIQSLASRHKLKILVASQWHYSSLVEEIGDFIKKNRKEISSVKAVFSRSFEGARKNILTSKTAFLPHILQILIDTHLVSEKSNLVIESSSYKKIKISYNEKIEINAKSDICAKEREETLKIFLKGNKKPALVANFSGVLGSDGFIVFPSVAIWMKKHQVKEDVLEKMIENFLKYFETGVENSKTLTLDKYLPVAIEEIRVVEYANKLVVVIGGGIFGTLSAIEIAKRGHSVVLLEKSPQLITGASLVNQCRVHMGYHYPRDEKTAKESLQAKKHFEKVFAKAILRSVDNHYLIAKDGSFTTPKDYLAFCKKMKLPYSESWPSNVSKEKIALSLKVPEPTFDADVIREILHEKLERTPSVTLLCSAIVTGIECDDNGYNVVYEIEGNVETIHCAAIVNATYSNLNYINKLAGIPLKVYQYELCEVPVARTPWKNMGWAIMDGPFFGIMPFGFSKNYLFYDVELSVLERMVGELPKFKFGIDYYDDKKRKLKRFDVYKKKWLPYVPDIEKCQHVSSMYVTRMVLPKKEKTDSRPTMIEKLRSGFWQLFSGKITTSVPQAAELGILVDKFLKSRKN